MILSLLLLLILSILAPLTRSAVFEGQKLMNTQWDYLAKFCFSNEYSGDGIINYKIDTPNKHLKLMLYLDYDSDDPTGGSWNYAYSRRNILSCDDLVRAHRGSGTNYGIASVTSGVPGTLITKQATRPYFWYLAVADCEADTVELTHYQITFLNPGGSWEAQLSFDEQGVPQLYIASTIFYTLIFCLHIWSVREFIRLESFHPIVKILTAALTLELLSSLSEMIHYLIYITNGIGAPGLKALGELLTMASELVLMFMCILVAKGWAITTSILTDKNLILIVMGLVLASYLGLFIWDNIGRDPVSTAYFFATVPGIIVLVLRILVAAWFVWCLKVTLGFESLPDKKRFYFFFGFCYTIWFLLLPILVCISLAIDPWYRFKVVRTLSQFIDTLGFVSFLILLWPSRASRYFNIKSSPNLLDADIKTYGEL